MENVVVELKRPTVSLGEKQLSLFGDEMGSRRLYTENTKNHVDRKVGAI